MKSDFELLLEECLAQIRNGITLEECLSAHPAQAKKLRPLLETAIQVSRIPIPQAQPEAIAEHRDGVPGVPVVAGVLSCVRRHVVLHRS